MLCGISRSDRADLHKFKVNPAQRVLAASHMCVFECGQKQRVKWYGLNILMLYNLGKVSQNSQKPG